MDQQESKLSTLNSTVKSLFKSSFKEWASEWLLFNAKSAIFQLYHGENNVHFDEMISALYKITTAQ